MVLESRKNLLLTRPDGLVRPGGTIGGRRHVRRFRGERSVLRNPLLAAPIDQANVLVAVIFQLPKGVGGEPVVVVPVQQNRGVVRDSRLSEQFFERSLLDQIATNVILQLG